VILLFIIGFGNGASALTFAVVRKSFPIKEVGVVSGFANMGGFLSAVLLPIIFGNVLDLFPQQSLNAGYHYAFMIPILFSAMGLLGVLLIKEEQKEEQGVLSAS
jgi:MFS family permease